MKFLQAAVLAVTTAAKLVTASESPGQDNQSGYKINQVFAVAALLFASYVAVEVGEFFWDCCCCSEETFGNLADGSLRDLTNGDEENQMNTAAFRAR